MAANHKVSKRPKMHETDSDEDGKASSSKKKKACSLQTFRPRYSEKYPVLTTSDKGNRFAFCRACRCDFSVAHGGIDDCRRHVETKKHVDATSVPDTPKIKSFFSQKKDTGPSVEDLTRAETLLVELIAEFNLPITAADRFTEACKLMFPDSKIAGGFSCGRSKATAIIKKLASGFKEDLISRMKKGPFSISTDGSNDANDKMFPLVIRTLDLSTGQVQSELLSLPFLSDRATGENIFQLIQHELEAAGVPWTNCIALGCDNANVMVGNNKGVYGFMQRKHPNIFLSGCVCHLIHIAAHNASSQLSLKIDELLVDVFFYLDKSSTRQLDLKAIQLYHEVKSRKILKHVSTRWLSLKACLPRLLENWEALKEFFKKEKAARTDRSSHQADRLERLYNVFRSPTSRLYCLFLKSVLGVFDDANLALQCDEPKIHALRRVIFKLQRSLFERYLKPVALANKSGELLQAVQFDQAYHHKSNEDLNIGEEARSFVCNPEKNALRAERVAVFYTEVKNFFMTASAYILNKLPVKNALLKHVEVADPSPVKRGMEMQVVRAPHNLSDKDQYLEDMKFLMQKYPVLIPPGGSAESVLLEFASFQAHILEQADSDCDLKEVRADQFWEQVKEVTDETGGQKFKHLPVFMQGILTIPHSSSHCERVFSCVRKNRSDTRASIGHETLQALLVVKSNPGKPCQRVQGYTSEGLRELKSCYKDSLKKYKK